MPTIEFNTYTHTAYENMFRPIPASKMLPDWWKKSKVHALQNMGVTITLRACPAMHDVLATGYYICTNRDIECVYDETPSGGFWHVRAEGNSASATNLKNQLLDNFVFIQGDGSDERPHDAFKFQVPWMVTTPPGYSCLYLDPFLFQNKYFRTWQGLMDTDMFNNNTDNSQVIVYPLAKNTFTILEGTPIVQVIPYRREEWVASYGVKDSTAFINEMSHRTSDYGKSGINDLCRIEGDEGSPDNQIPGGFYRKYMWTSKSRLYKDAKEVGKSEHADLEECPFNGISEKDFKHKQQDMTELNSDGNRDRGRYGEDER